MTREEAIANLNMISVAFVELVTKEQRKLIDDTFDMAIKALEQEPSGEWLRRQDVIKVLTKNRVHFYDMVKITSELKELSSVNQEPSGDLISRQAVQDYIAKYLSQYLYNDVREAVEVIDEYIGELPSVKQEPKTGHWINDEDTIGVYYCSECGGYVSSYDDAYCKYCGCRMVEPQERREEE